MALLPLDAILPGTLSRAVDSLVEQGESASLAAASQHAPITQKEKRLYKPHITTPIREMSLLKAAVLYASQRIRTLGHNTALQAVFETLEAQRLRRLHLRRGAARHKGGPRPSTGPTATPRPSW